MCGTALEAMIAFNGVCLFLFAYPLSIWFYYSMCCRKDESASSDDSEIEIKTMKRTSMVIFGCYLVYNQIDFILAVGDCANTPERSLIEQILGISGGISYFIGFYGILFVFLLRLNDTFIGSLSQFAISKKRLYFIYGYIVLVILWTLIGMGIIASGVPESVAVGIAVSLFISIIVLYISLIIMFWKRLILLVRYKLDDQLKSIQLSPKSSDDNDDNNDNDVDNNNESINDTNNDNNNDSKNKKAIINPITIKALVRYTLMVFTAFTSTLLTFSVYILFILIEGFDFQSGLFVVADSLWVLDTFINQFCICMLFGFSTKFYYQLCKQCDQCVRNCVIGKMRGDMNNEVDKKINLQTKQEYQNLLFR